MSNNNQKSSPSDNPEKPIVAVLRTKPESALEDIGRLMRLANYKDVILQDKDTALKFNMSWHHFYPACSTTPWQIEGVIRALLEEGHAKHLLHACHNRSVVVSAKRGEMANHHKPVVEKYGLRNIHLYEGQEWVRYEPKTKLLVLDRIFPQGIRIPKRSIGENAIHLPTLKTHVFAILCGAMENALAGLINEKHHLPFSKLHEVLVDLLAIQKEIQSGMFAMMDGTFAGEGPGPRCLIPHVKNMILASSDVVALDAIAAKMMGFDPMSDIPSIRLATELGLGMGDPTQIQVVGDDIADENWKFRCLEEPNLGARGQNLLHRGPLRFMENMLLRRAVAPWAHLSSIAYYDGYWFPFIGKARVREMLKTGWGQLFLRYKGGGEVNPHIVASKGSNCSPKA